MHGSRGASLQMLLIVVASLWGRRGKGATVQGSFHVAPVAPGVVWGRVSDSRIAARRSEGISESHKALRPCLHNSREGRVRVKVVNLQERPHPAAWCLWVCTIRTCMPHDPGACSRSHCRRPSSWNIPAPVTSTHCAPYLRHPPPLLAPGAPAPLPAPTVPPSLPNYPTGTLPRSLLPTPKQRTRHSSRASYYPHSSPNFTRILLLLALPPDLCTPSPGRSLHGGLPAAPGAHTAGGRQAGGRDHGDGAQVGVD